MIYLDNSLVAKPSMRALSAMQPYLADYWGSPTAPHQMGQRLYPIIEESVRGLYTLFGAKEADTVLFTSCGAEAVSQVFLSTYLTVTLGTGKNHFLTAATDEAPAILSAKRLEKMGCVSKRVKVDSHGLVTLDAIIDQITARTALFSLSWGNGLTGTIQRAAEIAKLCRERGILLHLDATHVMGKLCFSLDEVGADFITVSGEPLHAPKGTGALYVKAKTALAPLILGGVEQGGYRAGNLNVPLLVAFSRASEELLEGRDFFCMEMARLRDRFENAIIRGLPDAIIFFREGARLPHISCIGFPGVVNEALLYLLHRKQLFATIGGSQFQQIGLLLSACGIEEALAHSAISFSLSRETTEEDIDRAALIIIEKVKKLHEVAG